MPGEDSASALDAAEKFKADGITSEFTRLGENVTAVEEGDAVAEHYLALLDDIQARHLRMLRTTAALLSLVQET